MTLPASFAKDGFITPKRKYRRLMIGSDGLSDTGKTEFILSAPGPGIILALDRSYDGVLDNQRPPESRNPDFAIMPIHVPLPTQTTKEIYLDYWKTFYQTGYLKAVLNADARTVGVDGDSDSWELQRLAEFGKLTQIPSIMYTNVNAARRAMYARAWDSGKIIIATAKVKKQYVDVFNADGTPKLMDNGKPVREWNGQMDRQGFEDQNYLWQIMIRHLFKPAYTTKAGKEVPMQWGIRIIKCKVNPELIGDELWGEDCNFAGLVSHVYPHVPLEEWGFK